MADGFTGMLIDLDLAIVDGERTSARHMTGTIEFMAIDVLCGLEHTYKHDLESFLYVLLWICGRRAWEKEFRCSIRNQPKKRIFQNWYGDCAIVAARSKKGDMDVNWFELVLLQFVPAFDCIKPLCKKVRTLLFPPTEAKPDDQEL